ncbi:hypothetical protein [Flavobacterium sp.]|uniref:hypothetical protein n=1 Tax=Flavobacterium sp. TaxID=239 RepID=UPI002616FF90|nr:hypothetical protein [Flavobacterium sp.]
MKKIILIAVFLLSVGASAAESNATAVSHAAAKEQVVSAAFPIGGLLAKIAASAISWAAQFLK